MNNAREAGILLHPTSLPGPYGIGEIGVEAQAFVNLLAETGQKLWQVLPLGPTSYGDSPYQSLSTFAGNPLLLCLRTLQRVGLLTRDDLKSLPPFPAARVDYGPVITARQAVLARACAAAVRKHPAEQWAAYRKFCQNNADWLDDYALFAALKAEHGGRAWIDWDPALAAREPIALEAAAMRLRTAVRDAKILQYLFHVQWNRVRAAARARGIRLIGDVPIFVAHDSADVWAHRELFSLDEDGMPTVVAGVPPDYFSSTGQRWGNPLYRWDRHAADDFAWWAARLRRTFALVDLVRIDHFRGFESFWEIPAAEPTAVNGRWLPGPGKAFFDAMTDRVGPLNIIAEDLGIITPAVEALRDACGFPGMRVLQFWLEDGSKPERFDPATYPRNCVVYTGTHDNDTTYGWFHGAPGRADTRGVEEVERQRRNLLKHLKTDGRAIHWDLIGLALRTQADTAIVPLQDVLGLDSTARMNTPGRPDGNWQWRFTWDQVKPADKQRLLKLTKDTQRA